MIRAELITDFAALGALAETWQGWARRGHAGIFQHWGFVQAFWAGHHADVALRAIIVRRNGQPIGILPLQLRGTILEFLGSPESDANDLLCAEQDAAAVGSPALELLAKLGLRARLLNIPENSKLFRILPTLSGPLRRHLQKVYRCPAPARTLGAAPDMSNTDVLRKLARRLSRHGAVTFQHLETREEILAQLPDFFEQHITRSAAAGRASEFLSPARRAFFTSLVDHLDPRFEFRFSVVQTGGKPVAYHAGFCFEGRLVFYKPSFDVDYWDLSPGEVLLRSLLANAQQSGLEEFDFSIGDEPYKQRFANKTRHAFVLHFEPQLLHPAPWVRTALRSAEDNIRRHPLWIAGARSANARLKGVERATFSGFPQMRYPQALVYHIESGQPAAKPTPLSALANLCGHRAPASSQDRLLETRRRLKSGHSFYLLADDPQPLVVWTRPTAQIEIPELGADGRLALSKPGVHAYECWLGADLKSGRLTQRALQSLPACGDRGVWFYLFTGDRAQVDWLKAAGIHPSFHLSKRKQPRALLTSDQHIESARETVVQP